MPGYKAHIAGGALLSAGTLTGLIYLGLFSAEPIMLAVLVAISAMAALFPDTDTDSKGQNLYYGIMVVTDIALIINKQYQWAAILGLFAMFPALGHHRGWTHSWWAMLLVPTAIIALPWIFFRTPVEFTLPFYLAAVTGYFSHLAMDKLL